MPRVEIVQKHNSAARRLYIRGHNGKIYPYLVVNDSGLADARREERVLQVFTTLFCVMVTSISTHDLVSASSDVESPVGQAQGDFTTFPQLHSAPSCGGITSGNRN